MSSNIPSQETFLYKGKWTAEVDSMLLSVITRSKMKQRWSGTVIPIPILEEAVAAIASDTDLVFTWRELYERFQFFEVRFRTFDLVVHTRGVHWNVNTNLVNAPEQVWKEIYKRNTLAAAYHHYGDPEYHKLAQLFGVTEPKKEPNSDNDVVVLSDTTVPIVGQEYPPSPRGGEYDPSGAASESVCSPILHNVAPPRRKLFADAYQNSDNESGNESDHVFLAPRNKSDLKGKASSSDRSKSRSKPFNPVASPRGSSCGSNSPNQWWRNNFK